MNGQKTIIKLLNISKNFGNRKVLDNISLEVFAGETLVIIGRSGVGKSTILKHIAGLLAPDAGEVWVDGQELTRQKEAEVNELRKKMGVVFQYAALFDSLTVFET